MNAADQDRLATLIREGFTMWRTFHERYSNEQRRIKELDPGLAVWADVDIFLRDYAEARTVEGFSAQRFAFQEGRVESTLEPARVITFDGTTFFACGDYSGAPVFGPEGQQAHSLGLNSVPVTQALRRLAFPIEPVGAAHLRWPVSRALPQDVSFPFGVLVFLKQTLRSEQGSWTEISNSLHCYVLPRNEQALLIESDTRAALLRGLFGSTVRTRPDDDRLFAQHLLDEEATLIDGLRRLAPDDAERRIRHAVTPIFAAIVATAG